MMIKKRKSKKIVRHVRQKEKVVGERPKMQWLFFLCTVVFLGSSLYIFFCSHVVDVETVHVMQTQRTDAREIERVVRESFSGDIFWCIRKNNFFFVDKKAIAERVSQDQRIRNVDVHTIFPQTMEIVITEYEEFPVWCVEKSGTCHILRDGCNEQNIDQQSDLVKMNPHFTILDHAHEQLYENQCVISKDDLARISLLGKELIYAMDARIVEPYHVDLRGSREVKYVTDEGWYILVDVTQPTDEVIATAKLFMKQVIQMDQRTNIEYVDFRFSEKIFYKMKNEEKEDMDRFENEDEEKAESVQNESAKESLTHD